jgi:hypothetical protein
VIVFPYFAVRLLMATRQRPVNLTMPLARMGLLPPFQIGQTFGLLGQIAKMPNILERLSSLFKRRTMVERGMPMSGREMA